MTFSLKNRITFFDLETGGINPRKHPIIQIAAIQVDFNFENWQTFERKIQFDVSTATAEALSINSYDREVWAREAVSAEKAANDFKNFLNQAADVEKTSKTGRPYYVAQMAAHNASFDRDFIFAWYRKLKIFFPGNYHMIDTLQMALLYNTIKQVETPSLKLTDLCNFHGISLENAHDALGDVTGTAKLAYKFMTALSGQ